MRSELNLDGGLICHANFTFSDSSNVVKHYRALQGRYYTSFVGLRWLIEEESIYCDSGFLHGVSLWLGYGLGRGKLLASLVARLIICFGYHKIIRRKFGYVKTCRVSNTRVLCPT